MKVAVLYSGGKDSNASLQWARQSGHEVACLIGVVPEATDSFMYHVPATELMDLFPEALGETLVKVRAPQNDELRPLRNAIAEQNVEGIVSGAVRSEFQKLRLDRICAELGLVHHAPLWHADPEKHLRGLISDGYEIIFTGVAAEGLDEKWLNRRLDAAALEDLLRLHQRYGINLEGEGGEYETLVLSGPTHKKRIVIDEFSTLWRRDNGRMLVKRAHVE
jgi:ABC transporter with metal-binding/Fe-S-binding domain ATP-binding protein